jgi:hypothetical protein
MACWHGRCRRCQRELLQPRCPASALPS